MKNVKMQKWKNEIRRMGISYSLKNGNLFDNNDDYVFRKILEGLEDA